MQGSGVKLVAPLLASVVVVHAAAVAGRRRAFGRP